MAGRIPQAFLDDLLDRLDIVEVIDRRVKLKKSGKNYSARCPFHEEKTPSFSVNPEKQFYYCFGCGAGGNAIGFVMDYENVDFPQAVESLAGSIGLEVPREPSRGGPGQAEREQGNKRLYALMEQVTDYYKRQLRTHPEAGRAVDYLKDRGLTGQIAKRFDLGFAPPGWDNLLKAMGDSEEQQALLKKSGMLVENETGRTYDRFRDRVVFPIRDQRGRTIAFGGRVLGDDKPKYLNSPETEIFHKGRELYGLYQARKANRHLERILVVEGYMDVIALAQHGIDNATATLGTATSRNHLERIYRLCPEVVFCFDGDEAGRKAAFRALEAALPCMEDGRQARFLFLPEGEDPDTAVRKGGAEHFQALLRDAVPLETFLFDSVAEGLDTDSLDGRARLSKLALPYIRQLPEGVFRQLMFKELARRTGLELASLMQLQTQDEPDAGRYPRENTVGARSARSGVPGDWGMSRHPNRPRSGLLQDEQAPPGDSDPGGAGPRQRPAFDARSAGYANLAQAAIALILHRPEISLLADPSTLADLEGDDIGLLRELLELLRKRPESNTAMLLGHWYGTPEGELLSHLAGQERLIPTEGIEQQFVDTMEALSHLPHRSKFAEQVDKFKSTNYAQISELEKQRLREMLQAKKQRDEARNRRK
jgi:DNA primase